MRVLLIKVEDTRGERRTLITRLQAVSAGADQSHPLWKRAACTRLRAWAWTWGYMLLFGFTPCLVIWLIVERPAIGKVVEGVLVSVAMSGLISWILALFVGPLSWGDALAARDALIAQGICPGCAYGMGGISALADGCVVCPECGAAWRVQADRTESDKEATA